MFDSVRSIAVVEHCPGERDEHADVVAVVVHVRLERLLVAHRVQPRRGHHHRLGLAADAVGDVLAEVLDDHLGLLGQVVLVQGHEPGDGRLRLGAS